MSASIVVQATDCSKAHCAPSMTTSIKTTNALPTFTNTLKMFVKLFTKSNGYVKSANLQSSLIQTRVPEGNKSKRGTKSASAR